MKKYRYLLLFAAVVSVSGLAYLYNRADELLAIVSEKPRYEAVDPAGEPMQESTVALSLEIPFSDLVRVMQEELKRERIKGTAKKKCYGVAFIKTCFKPKYDLTVVPGEPSAMKMAEDAFQIRLPLDINGEVSSGGRVGNHMPFSSRVLLLAEGKASMPENPGCPDIVFNLDYRWLKQPRAKLRTLGNNSIKIDLTDTLNRRIRKQLDAYETRLSHSFDCEGLKKRVMKSARIRSKPLGGGAGKEPLAYLEVVPKGVGFSGLDLSDEKVLRLAFMVRMDVGVLSQPDSGRGMAQSQEIAIESINPQEGRVNVRLPVSLSYERIKKQLSDQLLGYRLLTESAVPVEASVEAVDIYPSSGSLVVGLKIESSLLGGFINRSSWLYFRVTPRLQEEGRILGFTTPVLTEIENDPLIDVLGFRNQLQNALNKTRFDIDSSVRNLMSDLTRELEGRNGVLKVGLEHGEAAFEELYLARDALKFVFRYTARMNATLQARDPQAVENQVDGTTAG